MSAAGIAPGADRAVVFWTITHRITSRHGSAFYTVRERC